MAQQDRSLASREKDTQLRQAYLEEAHRAIEHARHPNLGEMFDE